MPECFGMLDESATVNDAGELRCPHGESHAHDLGSYEPKEGKNDEPM
jgi:hypothetical protein